MTRTVECEVNGTVWQMPVTFAVASEIDDKVSDPFKLLLRLGDRDNPITIRECARVIAIGCRHAGCGLGEKDIGQWVVEEGFTKVLNTVLALYLNSLVSGPPKSKDGQPGNNVEKKTEGNTSVGGN